VYLSKLCIQERNFSELPPLKPTGQFAK